MNVYRGPKQKPFLDDTHEHVAKIRPEELERGVREKAQIVFNITKDGKEREAVCTTIFEEADLVPMASGILARLALQQAFVATVRKIMKSKTASSDEKLKKINTALKKL